MGTSNYNIGDRIKALRLQKSMTQRELGELLDVSVVTIRSWEQGNKSPSMSAIVSLAEAFHTTTDYVLCVVHDKTAVDAGLLNLSTDEHCLLNDYRSLDDYGKKAVKTICKIEKERISGNSFIDSRVINPVDETPIRYIPLYLMPSAAGFSVPLDGEEFEMLPVDSSVPEGADFAVRIQGDSMLPYIRDGDVVFVKKDMELSVGDVGIFSVDGAVYCKLYYVDKDGNQILASANSALRDTNIHISSEYGSNVVCYGMVLLSEHIEVPSYLSEEIDS